MVKLQNLSKIMFTVIRKWKRIVKTRMRQYNKIKTKTAPVVLFDPNSSALWKLCVACFVEHSLHSPAFLN